MTIYPPYFFQGCKLISKFKKVARLSYESDMCFNTSTFKQWIQAIQKEINQAMEDIGSCDASRVIEVKFYMSVAERENWDDSKLQKIIDAINRSCDRRISQINSKIRRLKGMFKIMDEVKENRKSKSKRLF